MIVRGEFETPSKAPVLSLSKNVLPSLLSAEHWLIRGTDSSVMYISRIASFTIEVNDTMWCYPAFIHIKDLFRNKIIVIDVVHTTRSSTCIFKTFFHFYDFCECVICANLLYYRLYIAYPFHRSCLHLTKELSPATRGTLCCFYCYYCFVYRLVNRVQCLLHTCLIKYAETAKDTSSSCLFGGVDVLLLKLLSLPSEIRLVACCFFFKSSTFKQSLCYVSLSAIRVLYA